MLPCTFSFVKPQPTGSHHAHSVYSGNPGFGERVRHDRTRFPFNRLSVASLPLANLLLTSLLRASLTLAWLTALTIGVNVTAKADDRTDVLKKFQETQVHMGSKFTIVVYAQSAEDAERGMKAAFQRIHELDLLLSDYLDESEVSRLSRASPTKEPVAVSDALWPVLLLSQEYSEASDGAFDITVGPLTTLWRRSRRSKQLPDTATLARAKNSVGYRALKLDQANHTAMLVLPGMRLDLGGIGQGYAADAALETLKQHDLPRAIVNASGDIIAGAPPPEESGWKIAFPTLGSDGQSTQDEIRLAHLAISTSGDAFQFVEIDGVRYSHIVDTRTGLGTTEPRTATVLADTCVLADAMATACCVLDTQAALKLADRMHFEVQLIRSTANGPRLERTPKWHRERGNSPTSTKQE